MPTPRSSLAVGVVDGRLYAVGGWEGGPSLTVEAYDPATDSWMAKTPMSAARTALGAGVVTSGLHPKLYAVGGFNNSYVNTLAAFNP
jgi:N-acetylneuraminic acid mutarotase